MKPGFYMNNKSSEGIYRVVGKMGIFLRQGAAMDSSPLVALNFGATVTVHETVALPDGTVRCRISCPAHTVRSGWCSLKPALLERLEEGSDGGTSAARITAAAPITARAIAVADSDGDGVGGIGAGSHTAGAGRRAAGTEATELRVSGPSASGGRKVLFVGSSLIGCNGGVGPMVQQLSTTLDIAVAEGKSGKEATAGRLGAPLQVVEHAADEGMRLESLWPVVERDAGLDAGEYAAVVIQVCGITLA